MVMVAIFFCKKPKRTHANLASHIPKDFFYVVRSGDFQIIIDDVVSGSLGSSVVATSCGCESIEGIESEYSNHLCSSVSWH